jgi:hypothetical protein
LIPANRCTTSFAVFVRRICLPNFLKSAAAPPDLPVIGLGPLRAWVTAPDSRSLDRQSFFNSVFTSVLSL